MSILEKGILTLGSVVYVAMLVINLAFDVEDALPVAVVTAVVLSTLLVMAASRPTQSTPQSDVRQEDRS